MNAIKISTMHLCIKKVFSHMTIGAHVEPVIRTKIPLMHTILRMELHWTLREYRTLRPMPSKPDSDGTILARDHTGWKMKIHAGIVTADPIMKHMGWVELKVSWEIMKSMALLIPQVSGAVHAM